MSLAPGEPSGPRWALVAPGRSCRAELVDPVADGRWAAFAAHHPDARVYHQRAWLGLLNAAYGCPVTACCLVDRAGTILAGAPLALVPDGRGSRRLECVPFAAACGPLPGPDGDPLLAHELVLQLDALRRRLGVPLELRGPIARYRAARVSRTLRAHRVPLATVPGGSAVAPPDGLTIERRTDAGALAELYRLQVAASRRRGRPAPRRRFVLGFTELFDQGLGFALLVRDRRQTLAAALLTTFNGTVAYECGAWAAAANARAAHECLLRAAVGWSCEARMRTLELGRVRLNDVTERRFSLALGARETRVSYSELGDGPAPRRRAGWAAPLVRRGPGLVSRALGEAVYPVGA